MSTFTKEQLRERAREKVMGLELAVTQTAFADTRAELEEELELARIALASLEAEAVACPKCNGTGMTDSGGVYPWGEGIIVPCDCSLPDPELSLLIHDLRIDGNHRLANVIQDLIEGKNQESKIKNTAPPAPVSVPKVPNSVTAETCNLDELGHDWNDAEYYAQGWNACRDAMLQGAEPVTTAYKLPANTPCKDAPEHIWLQTAGVWPENGEFSELTWCSDNQHEDDTLYVRADVVTGNSPVIPDGWVMVPVEPTAEMISSGIAAHYERSQIQIHDRPAPGPMECAYVAMLAAAPQQEV